MKHLLLTSLCLLGGPFLASSSEYRVYFGTYTSESSKGIYSALFDSANGRLSEARLVAETRNPSFLALHPAEKFLYAVAEVDNTQGKRAGAVTAFAVDTATGNLTQLNQQTSGGTGPCHISVDVTGKCALVANYGSGSIAALPINSDGSLGEAVTVIQHTGFSVNSERQAGPHAHFICPSPDNRFALACDLGLDKVLVYQFDAAASKLTPNDPPFAVVPHGAGPRHLVFHPNGKFVYVINEMAMTVTGFRYDAAKGILFEQQNISALTNSVTSTTRSSAAEIAVHPSGRFVYASIRGKNIIAVFAVDESSGQLKLVQNWFSNRKTPRHFAIDPTGRWLLAESQDEHAVVEFAIDPSTGELNHTGRVLQVPTPVCAVFAKVK